MIFTISLYQFWKTNLTNLNSPLIPEFPLPISSVSKHSEVNMNLQYYFQKCLSSLPPVPNAIKKCLPMMYNHRRIQNEFRHLLNCGLEGCHLCKPTEQWSDIIPKNVYNYYLRNMQAHHVSSCKTMEQLEAYIESYADSYNYDLKQFYRYIYQLLQGVGQRHYCFNDVTLSDCIYPVHEELGREGISVYAFSAAMFARQIRIFLNVFVLPHFLSLYTTHLNTDYCHAYVTPVQSYTTFCDCFSSSMVPSMMYLWSTSHFFLGYKGVSEGYYKTTWLPT